MTAPSCSVFKDGYAKIPFGSASSSEISEAIRTGRIGEIDFSGQISDIREGQGNKVKLPAFAASVSCTTRDKDATPEEKQFVHTGRLQCDFDGKDHPDWNMIEKYLELTEDPHVETAFLSPSGTGLKAIIRILANFERHAESWQAAAAYFLSRYGLKVDKSTKDPIRLCFFSHDPDAFFSTKAEELDVEKWRPIPAKTEAAPAPEAGDKEEFHDNDAGRARLFCARWRDEIRFIPERKVWLTWEGRWKRNHSGGMKGLAIKLADEMIQKAAAMKMSIDNKAKAVNRALTWGDRRTIDNLLSMAEADASIQWDAAEVDAETFLLGTPNVVIDLKTGTAREYSRDDKIILCTHSRFDANATAPRWEKFLEEVFPDPEVRRFVWKAAGYSITGDMGEEVFFIAHNSGRNGKSKFIGAICHVLGDYADTAGQALVIKDSHGADPKNAKAKIVGKRFLRAPEIEGNQKLNIGPIKDIVGGDPIDAEQKFKDPFTFRPVCKLWIATNHKPNVADTGTAIWERIRLIPFERYFKPEERDLNLDSKLKAEASGILNWLVQGALLWQAEGLEPPAKVRAAVDAYKREEDILADFIEECTEADLDATTTHSDIFKAYQEWTVESGIKFAFTKNVLAKKLREHGWRDTRTPSERINWVGRTVL